MSYVLIKTQVILLFCLSPVLHRREPKLAANYPENIYVHNLLEICIVSIFGRDTQNTLKKVCQHKWQSMFRYLARYVDLQFFPVSTQQMG